MSTDLHDAIVRLGRPTERGRNLRRGWGVIAILIVAAVFIEAVFAGAMLSGAGWARAAHAATALVLFASTITGGLVSLVTLRRVPHGRTLGLTLLSLGAVVLVEAVLGIASVHGANLLWAHVPLGVALLGLAAQAAAVARRLGGE
jgi:hypothetical protein